MKLGFLGLGRMGSAMCASLLRNGHAVTVYDTLPAAVERLSATGATPAADVAALCDGQDLLLSMLPSDEALLEAVAGAQGLGRAMAKGAVHVACGTHGVVAIEAVMAAHRDAGQVFAVCTVLGRPERAIDGTLGLIPAGPAEVISRIRPVLDAMGDTVFDAGENPLSSTAIKIANNLVLGCAIEAIGEGMALARRYGADPELFHQVLTQGLFDCTAYRAYGEVIAKQDWGRVGAAATIGLKDAELALAAAGRVDVPLPSVEIWQRHLTQAIVRGEAALDWAVMAREQFRNSGLE